MGDDRYVMVLLSDALEHPSGARTPSDHRCLLYARVPADGSRYVVEGHGTRVLGPGGGRPWTFDDPDSPTLRPFHFVADEAIGTFRRVGIDEL